MPSADVQILTSLCAGEGDSRPPDYSSEAAGLVPLPVSSTIVIVEPRSLIRDCLARSFQALSRHLVLACANSAEAEKLFQRLPGPFVFLFHPPDQDRQRGELEKDVRWLSSLATTVVLGERETANDILDALDRGAKGYIPTSLSVDVALQALKIVIAGGLFVPACALVARPPSNDPPGGRRHSQFGLFTERQAAVVEALRHGKANKIIAYELNMSEGTVKVHVRNILRKLKARNRTEVAYLLNNDRPGRSYLTLGAAPDGGDDLGPDRLST